MIYSVIYSDAKVLRRRKADLELLLSRSIVHTGLSRAGFEERTRFTGQGKVDRVVLLAAKMANKLATK